MKPELVSGLRARGARAVGLSGADGEMLTATRKPAIRSVRDGRTVLIRDDRSGQIERVDPTLGAGGAGARRRPRGVTAGQRRRGHLLNVDADETAARLAVALDAGALVLLTDVSGVLGDPADPSTRLAEVGPEHLDGDIVRAGCGTRSGPGCGPAGRWTRSPSPPRQQDQPIRQALGGAGTFVREGDRDE